MGILNLVLLVFASISAIAQAQQCDVGVDGCLWTCNTVSTGRMRCMIKMVVPQSCNIGSSRTVCGTTCTCSKADMCTVGVNGCQWSCDDKSSTGGVEHLPIEEPPSECYPGQTWSDSLTTCTCGIDHSAS